MKKFNVIKPEALEINPFTMIGKDWFLVTAVRNGVCNTMTASWGGLGIIWNKKVVYVLIRPQRYTNEFVDHADTFSLSVLDNSYRKALNYLGTVSGRDEDKIKKSGLTTVMENETAFFEEAHTVFLCKKLFAQNFTEASFIDRELIPKNYPAKDFHILYIAEIEKLLVKD